MRFLVEYRFVLSLACSAIMGVIGLHTWPFPADNVFLALIQARQPTIYAGFSYTYATVWFSTPFLVLSSGFSFLYIFVARRIGRRRRSRCRRIPHPRRARICS